MTPIIIILFALFVFLSAYYIIVFYELVSDTFTTKKELLLALIPFQLLFAFILSKWRWLK